MRNLFFIVMLNSDTCKDSQVVDFDRYFNFAQRFLREPFSFPANDFNILLRCFMGETKEITEESVDELFRYALCESQMRSTSEKWDFSQIVTPACLHGRSCEDESMKRLMQEKWLRATMSKVFVGFLRCIRQGLFPSDGELFDESTLDWQIEFSKLRTKSNCFPSEDKIRSIVFGWRGSFDQVV